MKTISIIFVGGAAVALLLVACGMFLLRMDSQYQAILLAQVGVWSFALFFPPFCAWGLAKVSPTPIPRIGIFVLVCTFLVFGVSSLAFSIMMGPTLLDEILREWGGLNAESPFQHLLAGIASFDDIIPSGIFLACCVAVPVWLRRSWDLFNGTSGANKALQSTPESGAAEL